MGDINIDALELLSAFSKLNDIKSDLEILYTNFEGLEISDELPSVPLVITDKINVSAINAEMSTLSKRILNNIKIIENLSADFAVYFSLYEKGYIDENGEWLVDLNTTDVYGMIYDQTNYGGIDYGSTLKDLSSNGCGFFSLLSVITRKTGHIFTYDEVKLLASGLDGSKDNSGKMEELASYLGCEYNFSFKKGPLDDLKELLANDNIMAIALINASTHFVPITGITDDGRLIINDTFGPSYWWNPVYQARLDELGIRWENGDSENEIKISASWVDSNGDGKNDDVWFVDFSGTNFSGTILGDDFVESVDSDIDSSESVVISEESIVNETEPSTFVDNNSDIITDTVDDLFG